MCRDLPSSAVNGPVLAWDYTGTMKIKRILTLLAVVAAGTAAVSPARSQQSYPVPQGAYSPVPAPYPYPPRDYPGDYRGPPYFDAQDDDDQPIAALPPPGPTGPILSPDDPRYAHAVPTGLLDRRSLRPIAPISIPMRRVRRERSGLLRPPPPERCRCLLSVRTAGR